MHAKTACTPCAQPLFQPQPASSKPEHLRTWILKNLLLSGLADPRLLTHAQVNLKLFQPAPGKRKTVLLFVIRDRTRSPFAKLCSDLRQDLDSIWESLVKPPEQAACTVEDFFDVNYVSLPSFEVEEDDFRAEATLLRRKFIPSHEDCLIKPEEHRVRHLHCAHTASAHASADSSIDTVTVSVSIAGFPGC